MTEIKALRNQNLQLQKMAVLGELVSNVAHELSNPLTIVIGRSTMICLEENLPEPLRNEISIIQEAAQCARKIVQNLLTFARQQKSAKSLVNLHDLLERTLALCAHELEANNITVVKNLAATLPATLADATQVQQVFLNLIMNARHAMLEAHGRGCLLIQTRILPSPTPGNGSGMAPLIEVTFADDGPGIPREHVHRIFEPFFTTKPAGQGCGLGLTISRRIIQNHGGRLQARNRTGGGATFVIELPVAKPLASTLNHARHTLMRASVESPTGAR